MSERVEVKALIPRGFYEAMKLILDTFNITQDEFVENAFRAELQSATCGGFESYAHNYLDGIARQVEALAGEHL